MKKFLQILMLIAFLTGSVALAELNANDGYVEGEAILYPEAGQSPNAMNRVIEILAYRNLAEQIDTLYISSNTTVREAKLESDVITTKVDAALRGAKIVKKVRNPDGSFEAVARISIYGGRTSLASAVLPEQTQVEDFPKPKFTNIESGSFNEIYTGLIIDCRGKTLEPAITPSIKSADGTEIYAYKNVTREMATEKGMVGYSDSIDDGTRRVGGKPLIIKAVAVSGDCDVVVSADDADRILAANGTSMFLNNCMVVFVR